MRKTALALTLSMALLFSAFFMSSVQAEEWVTPILIHSNLYQNYPRGFSMSANGTKITFCADTVEGIAEIFAINYDGTGRMKLITDPSERSLLSYPSISADGRKIAFSYFKYETNPLNYHDEKTYFQVFIINPDGSGLYTIFSELSSYESYGPCISADGSTIAFVANSKLFVIDSNGMGLTQLASDVFSCPAISSDGSKIAFLRNNRMQETCILVDGVKYYYVLNVDLFVYDSVTATILQVASNLTGYNRWIGPSISADGSKVAFSALVNFNSEIFISNSDGTGLKQITNTTADEQPPNISGDGHKIAFSSFTTIEEVRRGYLIMSEEVRRNDIFVANSDGARITEITSNLSRANYNQSEIDTWPCESPSINADGSKIAFSLFDKRIFFSEIDFNSVNSPKLSLLSPLTQTYNDSNISVVFTIDKTVNWMGYSLDGAENVTINGNTTITGLSSGLHNFTVYAKDLFGNVGASEFVVFKAEVFPFVPVATISIAAIALVCVGLLVYFKKRKS